MSMGGEASLTPTRAGLRFPPMRLLGLDIGTKTIGVAVSDEGGVVATPLRTLSRHGGRRDLDEVASVMRETGASALVLGLPLDLEGREGDAARRVRVLGAELARHLSCEVHYWDERFSTTAADRVLVEGGVRRRQRKQVVNHLAATLILQSFLDRASSQTPPDEDGTP